MCSQCCFWEFFYHVTHLNPLYTCFNSSILKIHREDSLWMWIKIPQITFFFMLNNPAIVWKPLGVLETSLSLRGSFKGRACIYIYSSPKNWNRVYIYTRFAPGPKSNFSPRPPEAPGPTQDGLTWKKKMFQGIFGLGDPQSGLNVKISKKELNGDFSPS